MNFFVYPKWSGCQYESVDGVFCKKHDNYSQRVYHQTDMQIEKQEDELFLKLLDKASKELAEELKNGNKS